MNMHRVTIGIFLGLSWLIPCARAEIVVIANHSVTIEALNKQQIQEIYLGRSHVLPDGSFIQPVDFSGLRNLFYRELTGRPIEQINAYWARISFSGQGNPPQKIDDEQAVVNAVADNKNTLGYVRKDFPLNKLVKVLFVLEDMDER
jgi:ABC-type phosphate transport system substrate-binding protein